MEDPIQLALEPFVENFYLQLSTAALCPVFSAGLALLSF